MKPIYFLPSDLSQYLFARQHTSIIYTTFNGCILFHGMDALLIWVIYNALLFLSSAEKNKLYVTYLIIS